MEDTGKIVSLDDGEIEAVNGGDFTDPIWWWWDIPPIHPGDDIPGQSLD